MDGKKYKELEKEGIDVLAVDNDGKVIHRTGEYTEKECVCSSCPYVRILPDPDPHDWFDDDDVMIYCSKADKVMAHALRPYEAFKFYVSESNCAKYK